MATILPHRPAGHAFDGSQYIAKKLQFLVDNIQVRRHGVVFYLIP
jgi:hypothetical protein